MESRDAALILAVLAVCVSYPTAHGRNMNERMTSNSAGDVNTNNHVMVDLYDPKHGVKMGVPNGNCDDAKTNLFVDWCDENIDLPECAQYYTCYTPNRPLLPNEALQPEYHSDMDSLPENYSPRHFCMDKKLTYKDALPTYGDHRPLWPKFGEYVYVPPQRWLHNIEHGAVVMLYHPCAHPATVRELKRLVKGCLRKHVVAASPAVPVDRPLALISWGHRMTMAHVEEEKVVDFIRKYAKHGPEGDLPKEGQYTLALLELAKAPPGSDYEDPVLCPNL